MKPSKSTQILTTISANLGAMAMGTILGYSSPAGPILLSGRSGLTLSASQNNWVGSIITIGACLGCPVGGYVMRKLGRRMGLVYSLIPYLISWALIIGAQSFSMLLIGRLISGLCLGITSVMVPTFIGEFASAEIRGALTSSFQLMLTMGVLIAYAMGLMFDSFRWMAVVCAVPAVLHSISIYFAKESPTYLLIQGRREEAKASLQFYRGRNYDVTQELEGIVANIEECSKNNTTLLDFHKPYLLRPLLIAIGLHIFQQASGVNAAIFNLAIIFEEAGTAFDSNISALIIGCVLVLTTAVSTGLVERLGRKFLLIISASAMTVSLVPLGAYFFLKEQVNGNPEELQELSDTLGWIPLVSLIVFIAGLSIGYGPIPWILMSEMFTSDAREVASSTATIFNWGTAFIVTITFGPLKGAIGSYGAYWLFAVICAANILFCIFFVPETKGKQIEEIVALFGHPAHKKQQDKKENV